MIRPTMTASPIRMKWHPASVAGSCGGPVGSRLLANASPGDYLSAAGNSALRSLDEACYEMDVRHLRSRRLPCRDKPCARQTRPDEACIGQASRKATPRGKIRSDRFAAAERSNERHLRHKDL